VGRGRIGLAAFLVVAGLIGAACGGDMKAATSGVPETQSGGGNADFAPPGPAASPAPGKAEGGGAVVLGDFQLPGVSQKIIKSADVSVQVKKGTFQQKFQQAAMVAGRHGGFVSSSRTTESKQPSGSLVIRVPASEFDATMSELSALGKVTGQQISGQDVTAQFVDLQARLRNWEAQEDVLLRLMRQSKSIEDSLKVQRTLQDVQLAIEEIRGQLRVLTDQTDLSTITLSMAEASVAAPKPKEGLTFIRAWRQAIHAIATVFAAIVVGLGYVIPVMLVALALLLMWIAYRRLRPRVVAGGTPTGAA
jgi:hypothetical protein